MSERPMSYEEARKIALREAKNQNKYTVNRIDHVTRQVEARYGKKAKEELLKETLSASKRKYGS